MSNKSDLLEKISEKGYIILNNFDCDLACFRNEVEQKYLKSLIDNNISHIDIEKYHEINVDDETHKNLWTRENRNFNNELIIKSNLYKFLTNNFGEISFSHMVDKKYPDIFWRLVRPNKKDVGPIHADIWFWDINNWKVPDNKDCLKIWMLLSKNIDKGLGVIDKSHLNDDWVYSNTFKDGLNKPEFDTDKNQYITNDLNTPFGSVILFDYRLLHYGIYNTTNYSRISLEFTILFNKK